MLSIGSGSAPVSPMAKAMSAQQARLQATASVATADTPEYDYPMRAPAAPLRAYASVPSEVTAEILRLRSEANEQQEAAKGDSEDMTQVSKAEDTKSSAAKIDATSELEERVSTNRELEQPAEDPSVAQQV